MWPFKKKPLKVKDEPLRFRNRSLSVTNSQDLLDPFNPLSPLFYGNIVMDNPVHSSPKEYSDNSPNYDSSPSYDSSSSYDSGSSGGCDGGCSCD